MNQKIIVLDTTLRDGEQALQTSLKSNEKLKIALSLERMGVDVIEAGFPISSPGNFKSVETISNHIKNSKICSLARCVEKDIEVAAQSMAKASDFRIHIFIGTSNLHVQSKLRKKFSEIIEMSEKSIKKARMYTNDVEFSCEDAGRTSIDNLCLIVEKVIRAGATTINIPDTVGYTTPMQFKKIIETLYNRVPNIHKAIISVHCHNDLGMAVGNCMSAIEAGARQIEGTINGLGERAGNTALEEIIMAIHIHRKSLGVYTGIKRNEIYKTSKIVSRLCNIPVPINKAIVGKNAFSHSSGIHQDGVLKNPKNYEIIDPTEIGLKKTKLNLTSRSGRAAVKHHMKEMGYHDQDYNIDQLYNNFLKLADKKGRIFDYDLEALAFLHQQQTIEKYFKLEYFHVQSKLSGLASASVILICGKKTKIENESSCNGSIDAIYRALNKAVSYPFVLKTFRLIVNGEKKDILGRVNIVVQYKSRCFHGIGSSKDVIEASAKAMVDVLNHIWVSKQVEKQYKKQK